MSPGDASARLTPYEIGIPGRVFADRAFGQIREEAETRSSDLTDPGSFILLGEVGRLIREIQGEDRGGEAIHRFGAFLFQAFHFHACGEAIYLLERDVARHLVQRSFTASPWEGRVPASAGYLQLPRHLFWSVPEKGDHAEPLDGVFWTRSSGETLSLLVALGIRTGRPGMSVTELPPVALQDAAGWPTEQVRLKGHDFSTSLPGGDLDGLYSVGSLGEVLKLIARLFTYLVEVPEALGQLETAARARKAEPPDTEPKRERVIDPPSRLPFRRIRLVPASSSELAEGEVGS